MSGGKKTDIKYKNKHLKIQWIRLSWTFEVFFFFFLLWTLGVQHLRFDSLQFVVIVGSVHAVKFWGEFKDYVGVVIDIIDPLKPTDGPDRIIRWAVFGLRAASWYSLF